MDGTASTFWATPTAKTSWTRKERREKLANKTKLLDEILGYRVGENYGVPTHKVLIDYYPPRGDAKEAWDVIDFNGMFGLPMSIRLNFQCRDSILAAPLAIDMARWVAALTLAGRKGPVPELGFYFKKPVGDNPPITFQEQLLALEKTRTGMRTSPIAPAFAEKTEISENSIIGEINQ